MNTENIETNNIEKLKEVITMMIDKEQSLVGLDLIVKNQHIDSIYQTMLHFKICDVEDIVRFIEGVKFEYFMREKLNGINAEIEEKFGRKIGQRFEYAYVPRTKNIIRYYISDESSSFKVFTSENP